IHACDLFRLRLMDFLLAFRLFGSQSNFSGCETWFNRSVCMSRVRVIFAAVFVLAFASAIPAQTLYGSLVGTVTDSAGLSVPGATVKITQTETSQSREATTNNLGAYSFPNIA